MEEIIYFLLIGLGVGSVYALATLSITLLFNGSGLLNFAQGEFLMVGALSAVALLQRGMPYSVAVVGAIVLTTLVAVLAGWLFSVPFRGEGYDVDLVTLGGLGLSIAFANAAAALFGRATYSIPSPVASLSLPVGSLRVPAHYVVLMVVAGALYVVTRMVYDRTDLGLQLRAVALDVEAARYSGMRIWWAIILTWAMAGLAGGLGGVLVGSIAYVTPYFGLRLTIIGLAGAMIGGLHSPLGAMLGGLVIGVAEALASAHLPGSLREVVAPALILLVLLLRPRGLMATARARTV